MTAVWLLQVTHQQQETKTKVAVAFFLVEILRDAFVFHSSGKSMMIISLFLRFISQFTP